MLLCFVSSLKGQRKTSTSGNSSFLGNLGKNNLWESQWHSPPHALESTGAHGAQELGSRWVKENSHLSWQWWGAATAADQRLSSPSCISELEHPGIIRWCKKRKRTGKQQQQSTIICFFSKCHVTLSCPLVLHWDMEQPGIVTESRKEGGFILLPCALMSPNKSYHWATRPRCRLCKASAYPCTGWSQKMAQTHFTVHSQHSKGLVAA